MYRNGNVYQELDALAIDMRGYNEMLSRLEPKTIIVGVISKIIIKKVHANSIKVSVDIWYTRAN